jgi:hypothetical protein
MHLARSFLALLLAAPAAADDEFTLVSVPAVVSLDAEGRVACRFVNPRHDELHVMLKARKR